MAKLSHTDETGKARMVDVGQKDVTRRRAVASARVRMSPETLEAIKENALAKGDVLGVARVAGIMAAKKVDQLIPLAHPLPIEHARVEFEFEKDALRIRAEVTVEAKTGVEMEALAAAAVAALTVYDMAKSADRGMEITDLRLDRKSGGRSGDFRRADDPRPTETKKAKTMGRIVSINMSGRKGVPKKPVEEARLVPGMGLAGDAHAAPGDRQVSLLMVESIDRARDTVEQRSREGAADGEKLDATILVPGIYAENLTTGEIDLSALRLGDEVRVGAGIRLRVSKIGKECHTKCAIYSLVGDCVMPREGIFCEVLEGGSIRKGDPIERC